MSRARGYAVATDARGCKVERDTITCGHCNAVSLVEPRSALAGCRACRAFVCARCDQVGRCTPFERRMERAEARDRARRSMGL